ncbi:hypothetical protein C5167_047861 [Papaver somniferum]|uniref:Uncharacterized protein n=1 Tax=Papaver somniferum TaxID=3469 RepID=A0A4Y7LJE0_PAPSO|nr:hypothetical protein C5167_047861 [Papaver somniferum]
MVSHLSLHHINRVYVTRLLFFHNDPQFPSPPFSSSIDLLQILKFSTSSREIKCSLRLPTRSNSYFEAHRLTPQKTKSNFCTEESLIEEKSLELVSPSSGWGVPKAVA